eukprot:TRINITY_DN68828_c0_g1_i1.p1 TRINITY_DN68828_c0_g1~~TRINITY_DN68828_c0_g1_i1.p1  ORF type:complete len:356 (+),score=48.16 TRINITY_DN68828_c0_g1_i1:53-1069(+)
MVDTQFVNFNKLSIQYSKGTGVLARNVTSVNINDCTVQFHGMNGVDFVANNSTLTSSTVRSVGCEGVSMYGGNHLTLARGNNVVHDNLISDFSRWKRTYMPGLFWAGVGNTYSNNRVTNGPHQAISGGGNVIPANYITLKNNYIANTTYETDDSGAMYTCGQSEQGWTNRGIVMSGNVFVDVYNQEPNMNPAIPINGIYLDDQMSGYTVYNNTFINVQEAILVGGGRHNIVKNNYCQQCHTCVHLDNRGMNWQKTSCTPPNGVLWKGLDAVHYTKPPYSVAFPVLKSIPTDHPCVPVQNTIESNLYCKCHQFGSYSAKQAKEWYSVSKNNTMHCRKSG